MKNQSVSQKIVVTDREATDVNSVAEYIALFDEEGVPFEFSGGGPVDLGDTPAIEVGAAVGTSPGSPSEVYGCNQAGHIYLRTGSATPGAGTAATITFATPFDTIPSVVLFPQNSATASDMSKIYIDVAPDGSGFGVAVGSALDENASYAFYYIALETNIPTL